ncbi:MAG: hypothetical protein AB7O37_20750 [Vicinamibacteria bacterium]
MSALRTAFSTLRRAPSLVLLLWLGNFGSALLLAVPLALRLERDLRGREAAANMTFGFDYAWWERWSEAAPHWAASLRPEIAGIGFAPRNAEILLRGELPARLFAGGGSLELGLDPVLLALGLVYLLLQAFLAGGVLAAFRARAPLRPRALLHGSAFYFGRMLRIALVGLLAAWVVFRLNAPLARFVDARALDSVSEAAALGWTLGRHALLLVALLAVHAISSCAKAICVLEERASAVLAWLSAAGFCLRNAGAVAAQYAAVGLAAAVTFALWALVDAGWETTGYRSQALSLVLLQAFVVARLALRLGLLGGQLELYRREAGA